MDQMGFELVDNGVLELPCSTPAVFKFVDEPELNSERFTEAIETNDFSISEELIREKDGEFYFKAKVMTDHYKDCIVKVWTDKARVYPREDDLDTYEFSRIVHAIEDSFGAELTHEPTE